MSRGAPRFCEKVTDLFVLESGKFSEDQVELFDSVMGGDFDRTDVHSALG
jgi:hypothetical protein